MLIRTRSSVKLKIQCCLSKSKKSILGLIPISYTISILVFSNILDYKTSCKCIFALLSSVDSLDLIHNLQ